MNIVTQNMPKEIESFAEILSKTYLQFTNKLPIKTEIEYWETKKAIKEYSVVLKLHFFCDCALSYSVRFSAKPRQIKKTAEDAATSLSSEANRLNLMGLSTFQFTTAEVQDVGI